MLYNHFLKYIFNKFNNIFILKIIKIINYLFIYYNHKIKTNIHFHKVSTN